jgi:large subunit ribosomal protein L4e
MKAEVLDINGERVKEIDLPEFFSEKIREDIIYKVLEAKKIRQPYAPFYLAGNQASASGKIRHGRRKWKTAYGHGISRVPRKIMWRRGTQFYWIGATISGARKGRQAHPPKVLSMLNRNKVNKKEMKLALKTALSATASKERLEKKYSTLKKFEKKLPIIVESKITSLKTKEFFGSLRKILDNAYVIAIQKKTVRAGKGKRRGRKYKMNAGLLLIVGKAEKIKVKGIEVANANNVGVNDLARGGLGRLVIYTENAIKELEKRIEGKSKGDKK